MKERTIYTCEICDTDYLNNEDATACEELHKKAIKIRNTKNRPNEKYPTMLEVEMADGTFKWYRQ